MKILFQVLVLISTLVPGVRGQNKADSHLLDGTTMDYYYEDSSGVHLEIVSGKFKYTWIAGPYKNASGEENYRSRKIGDKMYLVNFFVEAHATFVTIVFDFAKSKLSTSALLNGKQVFFEGGKIEQFNLKEN